MSPELKAFKDYKRHIKTYLDRINPIRDNYEKCVEVFKEIADKYNADVYNFIDICTVSDERSLNRTIGVYHKIPYKLRMFMVLRIAAIRWMRKIEKNYQEADKLRILIHDIGWDVIDNKDRYTLYPTQGLIDYYENTTQISTI